jgi:hypothetical protein
VQTDLMVIVPFDMPSRAATLRQALGGTDIRVLVDRRRNERRREERHPGSQAVSEERRRADRRAVMRPVAYVYACPVVAAIRTMPAADTTEDPPASRVSSSAGLDGPGLQSRAALTVNPAC